MPKPYRSVNVTQEYIISRLKADNDTNDYTVKVQKNGTAIVSLKIHNKFFRKLYGAVRKYRISTRGKVTRAY